MLENFGLDGRFPPPSFHNCLLIQCIQLYIYLLIPMAKGYRIDRGGAACNINGVHNHKGHLFVFGYELGYNKNWPWAKL